MTVIVSVWLPAARPVCAEQHLLELLARRRVGVHGGRPALPSMETSAMPPLLFFGPIHCTAVPVNVTVMLAPACVLHDSVLS